MASKEKLIHVIKSLHTDHYLRFPCLPCVFCDQLLYSEKAKWISYDFTCSYPINIHYPTYQMQLYSHSLPHISSCASCVFPSRQIRSPLLAPIPDIVEMFL